ncbi:MAG: hypothetical protein RR350_00260 [Oscillibacter sp.]
MKMLTAQRPIQYMGRVYNPGEQLPAHDGKMLTAWLNAGSATWTDSDGSAPEAGQPAPGPVATPGEKAAKILESMGVAITDDAGDFVGAECLMDQIRAAMDAAPKTGATSDDNGQGTTDHAGAETATESGAQPATGTESGVETVATHLDAGQLVTMKKADLEKLAGDMGVDISEAKNNGERAKLLAAVPVEAPKQETGGAQ